MAFFSVNSRKTKSFLW